MLDFEASLESNESLLTCRLERKTTLVFSSHPNSPTTVFPLSTVILIPRFPCSHNMSESRLPYSPMNTFQPLLENRPKSPKASFEPALLNSVSRPCMDIDKMPSGSKYAKLFGPAMTRPILSIFIWLWIVVDNSNATISSDDFLYNIVFNFLISKMSAVAAWVIGADCFLVPHNRIGLAAFIVAASDLSMPWVLWAERSRMKW